MARREKKVFDIPWEKEGVKLKIPVTVGTRPNYEDGDGEDRMSFRAVYKPAGIDEKNTDVNELRKAILTKLDLWYSITWELYFLVTVEGGNDGHLNTKFKVSFEMEFFVIGKDSRGEGRYMRIPRPDDLDISKKEPTRWASEEPQDGLPETGERMGTGSFRNRDPWTRSLVKATPEAVAAADKFIKSMEGLLKQMHHHFAPARIEKLLARSMNLLPAPKKEK